METLDGVRQRLTCPLHRSELRFSTAIPAGAGVPWPDGEIACPQGCRFSIEQGIPRFVSRDSYASAFGLQWRRYRLTQLDSYSGQPISRVRLERCLGAPLSTLAGKTVLEVGCGAGRFTAHLTEHAGLLVSMDLSDAVDANLANCSGRKPYGLLQADVNASPLPERFFDVVICLGVIQHTPSPEQTIASLARHVRPGGSLVIDHYTLINRFSGIGREFTLRAPLRAVLKRLPPELGLKATIALTAICDPVRKRTSRIRWLDRIACRIFPTACYYHRYPGLDPAIIREWNELDTHDQMTAVYRHVRSRDQIRQYLHGLGFTDITCSHGGNGVEARAVYGGAAAG